MMCARDYQIPCPTTLRKYLFKEFEYCKSQLNI